MDAVCWQAGSDRNRSAISVDYRENAQVHMNAEHADQILSQVFASCDYESNIIPLDVLTTAQNYHPENNKIQCIITAVILAVLLLLPTVFVLPSSRNNGQEYDMTAQETQEKVQAVKLRDSRKEKNEFTLFFDEDSGELDYDSAYAVSLDGERFEPITYSRQDLSITFPWTGKPMNFFIENRQGNRLQLVLTPR